MGGKRGKKQEKKNNKRQARQSTSNTYMSLGNVSGLDERSLLHGELDVVMPERKRKEGEINY